MHMPLMSGPAGNHPSQPFRRAHRRGWMWPKAAGLLREKPNGKADNSLPTQPQRTALRARPETEPSLGSLFASKIHVSETVKLLAGFDQRRYEKLEL